MPQPVPVDAERADACQPAERCQAAERCQGCGRRLRVRDLASVGMRLRCGRCGHAHRYRAGYVLAWCLIAPLLCLPVLLALFLAADLLAALCLELGLVERRRQVQGPALLLAIPSIYGLLWLWRASWRWWSPFHAGPESESHA